MRAAVAAENRLNELFAAALAARRHAYAPYSGFAVGAAALGRDGRIYGGCNVENASYPIGTCAEGGAIAAMVAGGCTGLAAMVVVADGPTLIAPCGACRQRLREFGEDGTPIHLARPTGIERAATVADLLPVAFGRQNLGSTVA